LVKYIAPDSTVIDVGANCGDSVAAMYSANRRVRYVCIEPDNTFFHFLKRNALEIKKTDDNANFALYQSFIGKSVSDATLVGSGGSKHAVISADSSVRADRVSSQTLDRLVSETEITGVRLLKSDVDGFDYDVIDSAEATIKSETPILFFECQMDNPEQKSGYERTIGRLREMGYENWVVFDNFGEVVLQTKGVDSIFQLFEYVWRQNSKRSTRTIYYYDILAATNKDETLISQIIGDYLSIE
jgi:FkbM family methyltransferase